MSGAAPQPCWIPERFVTDNTGDARCRWIDVAGLRFTDPFFDSTVRRRRRDSPTERWSTVAELLDEAATVPAVNDVVFIFHVSRCGSTLMSQLFGLDERTLVLSETPLLDAILRTDGDRARLFDGALRLLGRPRDGAGFRLVVKTDGWHLFHAASLRRLYPQARFVLLYRRPADVLGSHHKMRGMHMVPGVLEAPPFHVPYDPERLMPDQYAAAVLERHYAAMLDIAVADECSLLAGYEEGFPAVFLRTTAWLGRSFAADDLRLIHERCGYHAKRPHERFGGETLPCLQGVDLRPLDALFAALEQRRAATASVPAA